MNMEWVAGQIFINKPLDEPTKLLIKGIATTRRMQYDVIKLVQDGIATKEELGVQGEFFIKGENPKRDYTHPISERKPIPYKEYVSNHNSPPSLQPSLWCPWTVNDNGTELIHWNKDSSTSCHDWLCYIQNYILAPKGYQLEGEINWVGAYTERHHTIARNGIIHKRRGFLKHIENPIEA